MYDVWCMVVMFEVPKLLPAASSPFIPCTTVAYLCVIYDFDDVWSMRYEVWSMGYVIWGMRYEVWCMVHNVWCMMWDAYRTKVAYHCGGSEKKNQHLYMYSHTRKRKSYGEIVYSTLFPHTSLLLFVTPLTTSTTSTPSSKDRCRSIYTGKLERCRN